MGVLRGIGKGLAGTAAVAGAGAAWAGRGLGLGNTMAAAMATGAVFKMGMDRVGSDSDSGTDSGTATDKDKAEAQESWAGSNKILLAIYKDVVGIRQHLKGSIIPESVTKELALERESRFAKIMEALRSEGLFVGPAEKEDVSGWNWKRSLPVGKIMRFFRRTIPFIVGILARSWKAIKFLIRRIPWILAGLVLWEVFTNWPSIVASIKEIMADIKAKIDAAVAWVNDMIQPIKDAWEDAQDLYLKAIDFTTETLEKMFGDGADALDEDALDDKEIALAERILDKEEQILEEKIKLDNLEEGSIEHQRGTAVIDRLEGELAVLMTAYAKEKITNAERVIEKHKTKMEKIKQYAVDPAAASFIASILADDKSVSLVQLPDGTYIRRANVSLDDKEIALAERSGYFGQGTDILTPEELQIQMKIIAENKDIILQEAPNIPVDGKFTPDHIPSSSSKLDDPGAEMNKGGKVPGSGNTDTVPAMLTPGEFVMSKDAVQKWGVNTLEGMNAAGGGTNRPTLMGGYNEGGKEKEQQQQTEGTPPDADGPAEQHAKPKEDAIKKDEKAIDKKSEDVGPYHPQPGLPDPKPGDDWFFDEKGKLNIIIRGNKNTSTSITPGNLYLSPVTGTYMPLLENLSNVTTQKINRATNNASIKKTSKNYKIDYGAENPYQPLYKKYDWCNGSYD